MDVYDLLIDGEAFVNITETLLDGEGFTEEQVLTVQQVITDFAQKFAAA
jgi:hypothetical protein